MNYVKYIMDSKEYFEDFITRATHHSNAIEGSTLSMAETYAIIFNRNDVIVKAKPREIYDAINHKYALDYILKIANQPLEEKHIINIAKLINKNINDISGYRNTTVLIRGAEHVPPKASELRERMMYYVYNFNNTKDTSNVYENVAKRHIDFERIHPFVDGNGRTGRLLIVKELLKNNLAPAVITKEHKLDYINFIEKQEIKSLGNMLQQLSLEEKKRIDIVKKSSRSKDNNGQER